MKTEPTLPLNEILLRISKIEEKQDWQDQAIQELSKLIQELQANSVPKSKTSKHKPEKGTKQVSADWHIAILFLKYPEKSWTSDELAAKIGCSGAAVRKTSTWKAYQKQKNVARQQCSNRKRCKDKNSNITAAIEDEEIDD